MSDDELQLDLVADFGAIDDDGLLWARTDSFAPTAKLEPGSVLRAGDPDDAVWTVKVERIEGAWVALSLHTDQRDQRHLERLEGYAERAIDFHVEEGGPEPADRLQEFMARTGLTPYWVAVPVDVSEHTVRCWLAGDKMTDTDVQRLERMLGELPDENHKQVNAWIFAVPETGVSPWHRWTAYMGWDALLDGRGDE